MNLYLEEESEVSKENEFSGHKSLNNIVFLWFVEIEGTYYPSFIR